MADLPPDELSKQEEGRRAQSWTLYIGIAALAISVGHVAYAFLRNHIFD